MLRYPPTKVETKLESFFIYQLQGSPIKRVFFNGKKWEFTLNPGPFKEKEHVLITIFTSSGATNINASHVISVVKVLYKKEMSFFVALMVIVTTQVLGVRWGWVVPASLGGPCRHVVGGFKPQNLVQVSLFRYICKRRSTKVPNVNSSYFTA